MIPRFGVCAETLPYSSTLIEHLKSTNKRSDYVIAFFYCDYKDPRKQDVSKVFETILAQIADQNPAVLDQLQQMSTTCRKAEIRCSPKVLQEFVIECLALPDQTSIVIDALDECNNTDELLHLLQVIIMTRPKLRLFLTSRREYDIEMGLSDLPQIHFAAGAIASDIEAFVQSQLQTLVSKGKLRVRDPNLKSEIREALCDNADGM